MDGHELLSELKANEAFASIPVIVLTSSTQLLDRTTAAAQKASGYLRKPLTAEALFNVVLELEMFDVTLTRRPVS